MKAGLGSSFRVCQSPPVQNITALPITVKYDIKVTGPIYTGYDSLNEFGVIAANRFYPRRSGRYYIHYAVGVQFAALGNDLISIGIAHSGGKTYANTSAREHGLADTHAIHASDIIPMIPGDWIEVRASSVLGARNTTTGNGLCYIEGKRIS